MQVGLRCDGSMQGSMRHSKSMQSDISPGSGLASMRHSGFVLAGIR